MLESAFLFVGRIAFVWTLVVVIGATYLDDQDDALAIMGGVIGFVLWGVWTFGTLNIEVVGGGVSYTFSHPELTILGVALAMVPGYIALTGPIEIIGRYRDATMDDL
ncbi:MAG: hypothetical protein ACNS61_03425 [Candidatus Wenzhouxiangella sp. M2_3B_020]